MAANHPLMSNRRCVEPRKRMVAGRYGWAIHRFPIKGGKTVQETVWRDVQDDLAASVCRPSYFARLLGGA